MPAETQARLLDTMRLTDTEIRYITRNAAKEADRIIRSLEGKENISSKVRSAQIAVAKANAEMWGNVLDATKVGIGDAVDSASEFQALFDERMFASSGFTPYYWKQSMLAAGREGIESIISRKTNNITLSDRVYRNASLSNGTIDKIVNNGLLLGKSAREIARDVGKFINPATPGGASYAAMRLARTEINNAFHETSIRHYKDSPWVETVKWNLSGSHPRPDECNDYAESTHFRGGSAGEYRPSEVPGKPHPNCLCYVEPVVMSLDQFAKNFKAGKYDAHISEQMGCGRVA